MQQLEIVGINNRRESKKAKAGFLRYCMMGESRSAAAVYETYVREASEAGLKRPAVTQNTVTTWCTNFNWVKRAEAWDTEQQAILIKRWQDRRAEVAEADWNDAAKLRTLAQKMLDQAPNFLKRKTTTVPPERPGDPVKEIHTLAIDSRMMLQMLELSSRIQRTAVELPTSHVDVTSAGEKVSGGTVAVIEVVKDYGGSSKG